MSDKLKDNQLGLHIASALLDEYEKFADFVVKGGLDYRTKLRMEVARGALKELIEPTAKDGESNGDVSQAV